MESLACCDDQDVGSVDEEDDWMDYDHVQTGFLRCIINMRCDVVGEVGGDGRNIHDKLFIS